MANLLEAIKYERGSLKILDQTLLPESFDYITLKNTDDAWHAIKDMKVRGAPAIAITGCLSLAVELFNSKTSFQTTEKLCEFIGNRLKYLVSARPTAVNMKEAASRLSLLAEQLSTSEKTTTVHDVMDRITAEIEEMLDKDITDNKNIGRIGAEKILADNNNCPVSVVTHCNTGSLATAGYGTALGVIRSLHEKMMLKHVYCTETRPYNQGSRLTAFEIKHEQMPGTLVCDSMVAMLMKEKNIAAVVVGADRVVANGDTANKIGTYQLAIVAKYHGVPFYVAAPSTSCDMELKSGTEIVIEERNSKEMTSIKGIATAPKDMSCWNPAFDITPSELITGGIITEFGLFKPSQLETELESVLTTQKKKKLKD
ncbi:methylthioribose-1-phosphate isomerase [Octopus bimaculoides]|uniref:Methylthioribose-1-phosphate isomerase n=1 Tax=Octopus bimaculoides TaxID=37653 RepID=A0A0L8IFG3_OCTBM|nr:methylthioribose-1-phosphate isomerase [Octopus bimaculoides]|eukprot:XP_014769631.1 PREDICTED: methylthioribose-1-phosphate isomerase-like isoform X1 [Octopus bimaculoides]